MAGQILEGAGGVGVVEALRKAVNKDTGIRAGDLDLGVGSIVVLDRQEGVSRGCVGCAVECAVLANNAVVAANNVVAEDGVNRDTSKESAVVNEKADHVDGKRDANGAVDSVLDGREDGHKHTDEPDQNLDGRYAPKLVQCLRRCDQVTNSMNDDGRQRRTRNVEEDSRKGVDGEENDDGGDNTSQGRSDTGLGLDGSSAERSGRRVATQEGSKEVRDTDGDHLLRWVDDVVVDSAKGLGNGNVFDQENDDGSGQITDKGLDDPGVDDRHGSVSEATRHIREDGKLGVLASVHVHEPTDHGVEEDDKNRSQRRDEEVKLLLLGISLGHLIAGEANQVQHGKSRETHGGIELGCGQEPEGVDDNQVCRVSRGVRLGELLSQHGRNLTSCNVDGRAGHKSSQRHKWDELHDASKANDSDKEDNGAGNDSQSTGDDPGRVLIFWQGCDTLGNDVSGDRGHDSDRTNGDVLGRGEEPVDQDTHEGRVETILNGQVGELGVSHSLRNDDSTDSDTSNKIANQPL